MPNRIIKESICTSETAASLTDFEFRLWIGLILVADDAGRGDARAAVLRGRIFPLRERVTVKDVESALHGLAAKGCVSLYTVGGKPYFWFPTWTKHQRIRDCKPKYPGPEESDAASAADCGGLPQLAAGCGGLRPESKSESKSESEEYTHPTLPEEGTGREEFELAGFSVPDNARLAQEAVQRWFESRGFSCRLEVPVQDRGDGQPGRIDLLARKGDVEIAVEIDRGSPRDKSLFKLRQFDCRRAVLVRDGAGKSASVLQDGTAVIPLSSEGQRAKPPDPFASYAGEDAELLKALRDFEEMRLKIKKPMTDRAKRQLCGRLDALAGDSAGKIRLLDEAVLHCWQSVYPRDGGGKGSGTASPVSSVPGEDAVRREELRQWEELLTYGALREGQETP